MREVRKRGRKEIGEGVDTRRWRRKQREQRKQEARSKGKKVLG